MSDPASGRGSSSPPARRRRVPSWFDLRFLLGVLLVLGSVAVGARLFAVADRTVPVWAVARDLGSGTVLTRDDLVAVRVRLPESGDQYLAAGGGAPVGRPLVRDVGAGELLPRAALAARVCGSEVSIPVSALHVPPTVRRGVRVDVFATPRAGGTTRVLAAVTVQNAARGSDFDGGSALVVRVADELAPAVVRAVRTAEIDVVVVNGRGVGDGCGVPPPTATPVPSAEAPESAGPTGSAEESPADPSGEPPPDATTGSGSTDPGGATSDGGGDGATPGSGGGGLGAAPGAGR